MRSNKSSPRILDIIGLGISPSDLSMLHKMFSEHRYLEENPDVAEAVSGGSLPSGLFHYVAYGHREGRAFPKRGEKPE